jgi:hypothetical protein
MRDLATAMRGMASRTAVSAVASASYTATASSNLRRSMGHPTRFLLSQSRTARSMH